MSVVTHKYTPAGMPARELEATFAARGHTLDYLLKALRDQIHSGTLSSFVITGPRGSGKSTLIHMVALRIEQEPEIRSAWSPVVFPEEQFEIASLRDLLAATLRALARQGLPLAQQWLETTNGEADEEQSAQFAMTGLREVMLQSGKRLVLFVENLDDLLERRLDDRSKGTLRRLLMIDPFMMLIGSSVHVFDSLKRYDEAFFNYFGQVPLDRLDDEQVFDLLRRRAEFDKNEAFLRKLPEQHAKIRAIVHLSGGNPRLILMLYELLSHRELTTIVQYLRKLVDELTPLLKDAMEKLPPQQQKVIHALMEKGGTATPTELVGPTRLPLNAINSQLKRLRDAQIVQVLGGGKGRTANYTVPDKLFAIWYQMRYLSQNRRRIELFVDVLRIWFEEEERFQLVRSLTESEGRSSDVSTAEYFAASLRGTKHEKTAIDLCLERLTKIDLREAAILYAEFQPRTAATLVNESLAYTDLARWLIDHNDLSQAFEAADRVVRGEATESAVYYQALNLRGITAWGQGDAGTAMADFNAVIDSATALDDQRLLAFVGRGHVKAHQGDFTGAIGDYSLVIGAPSVSAAILAIALFHRGLIYSLKDDAAAIADYSSVLELPEARAQHRYQSLYHRAVARDQQGDLHGAIEDYSAVIAFPEAAADYIGSALADRAALRGRLGDAGAEIADYTMALKIPGLTSTITGPVLRNRAFVKAQQGDLAGASADIDEAIHAPGLSARQLALSRMARGFLKVRSLHFKSALEDFDAVIESSSLEEPEASADLLARALIGRGFVHREEGNDAKAEIDFLRAIELPIADAELFADALARAFDVMQKRGDSEAVRLASNRIANAIAAMPSQPAREAGIRLLSTLAAPDMKGEWPVVLNALMATDNPELKAAVELLMPVSVVLETSDRTVLESLPPEQRDFVNSVLERFEERSSDPTSPGPTER